MLEKRFANCVRRERGSVLADWLVSRPGSELARRGGARQGSGGRGARKTWQLYAEFGDTICLRRVIMRHVAAMHGMQGCLGAKKGMLAAAETATAGCCIEIA
eukprot:3588411-Rhodomonas_salina.2